MTGRAAGAVEQGLALQDLRVVHVTARRNRQIAGVEEDQVHHGGGGFETGVLYAVAVRPGPADGLGLRAVAPGGGRQGIGDADIAGHRRRALFGQAGLAGLPAKAAEHHRILGHAPNPVGAAGNAVAVGIVRIGGRQDIGFGDRFQQAEADHRLCHPRTQHDIRVHRAVAEIGDAVGRLAQRDHVAAGQLHASLLVGDRHPRFAVLTGDGQILQLAAIGRLRHHGDAARRERGLLGGGLRRDRQAQEHRDRTVIRAGGRVPTTVLEMAALAGAGVVQRPEPIGCLGRGRCRHPEPAEQTVADEEICAVLEREAGRGLRESLTAEARTVGRRAAGQGFPPLGPGEIIGRREDGRPLLGRHRRHGRGRRSGDDGECQGRPTPWLPQHHSRALRVH